MKAYNRSWRNEMEEKISTAWSDFTSPMHIKISEGTKSTVFIAASFEFTGRQQKKERYNSSGSLYYKILVNGVKVSEYHVTNPSIMNKSTEVNLHGVSEIPAGDNTIEIQYKIAKNDSWDILRNFGQRNLNVLTMPVN